MHIFLRRNGKLLGSFDREDYLTMRDQGGVFSDDEWCHVGAGSWCSVGDAEPFLRRSEEKRKRMEEINQMSARAAHDSYNFKVWYCSVSHRPGLAGKIAQPDAPALVGRSFISVIRLARFGAFSEAAEANFSLINPDVRRLSPLCREWLCPGGLGKTSMGRAVEMVRNVAEGRRLSQDERSYLHRACRCTVTVEFRFKDGPDSATLVVEDGVPILSASSRVREALSRVRFFECIDLPAFNRPRNYLDPITFEIIRAGWLGVFPGFPILDDGSPNQELLRRSLGNPRNSERILAEPNTGSGCTFF
jgi:hypothetical protein